MESDRPLYPKVLDSHPDLHSPFLSTPSSSSLYPSIDMHDLVENLFPDSEEDPGGDSLPEAVTASPAQPPPDEDTLICVSGAILHLIDAERSIELSSGDFSVVRIRQGDSTVTVLARLGSSGDGGGDGEFVQWPLTRDEAAVKLDDAHYFFSLHVPHGSVLDEDDGGGGDGEDHTINYGLTFASKGQEALLVELDAVLETYSSFSVQKVKVKPEDTNGKSREKDRLPLVAVADVLDVSVAKEATPAEALGLKKKMMEERSAVYWTTLAPNVEDYGTSLGKLVAKGSGKLIKGILWSGDVAVDRLMWGEELLKQRIESGSKPKEISKKAMRRMRRVRRITKMTDKVANGILHGILKVSGFVTSSIINSKPGQKFFSLLPGEVALASLDGFVKICDALEVTGKNVLRSSSLVTTNVVSHRYGDEAGELTNEGLRAAGHAIGTAYAVFKIRKALKPENAKKPSSLAKTAVKLAANEVRTKKGK